MSAIEKIAYHLDRRDEVPNQELAKALVEANDVAGFDEIASYLYDKNKSIASDCLKVLYEAGYIKPELVAKYVDDYLKLLRSKNNRMVWGAMIALWNIAHLEHVKIYADIDRILYLTDTGTVITHVTGIKLMGVLVSVDEKYYNHLYPILLNYLKNCRPVDFGKRVEDYMLFFSDKNKDDILAIVMERYEGLNKSQSQRIRRALKKKGIVIEA